MLAKHVHSQCVQRYRTDISQDGNLKLNDSMLEITEKETSRTWSFPVRLSRIETRT